MISANSLIRLAIASAVMVSVVSPAAADLPTVPEVLAIHRTNREKLSQLHLQWTFAEETTEASCQDAQRRADHLEKVIAHWGKVSELSAEEVAKLEITVDGKTITGEAAKTVMEFAASYNQQELKRLRSQLKPYRLWSTVEVYMNGTEYQLRRPPLTFKDEAKFKEWSFPIAPITPTSLQDAFGGCDIFSWTPQQEPAGRRWAGSRSETMYITNGHRHHYDLAAYLATPMHASWDNRHPIDTFFLADEDKYRFVKQEEIDGRLLTVVDALVEGRKSEPRFLLRGWLDLQRGAVPMKVFEQQIVAEAGLDLFDQWQPSNFLSSHSPTTKTEVVLELPNGGYYPARTVRERPGDDPHVPSLTTEQWAEVRAGTRERPRAVVHRRSTWDCTLVELKTDWEEKFFVIPLADDKAIYDYDAEKVIGALEPKPLVEVGQNAPPLTIARWLDGKQRTLEDFQGQVVVLDFWGLWCGPCRSSVPKLKELQSKFDNRPVAFISIHTAERGTDALAEKIEKFAKEQDWNYLAAIDSGRMIEDSATVAAYGISGFPHRVIIGPDGKIVYVDPGAGGPDIDEDNPQAMAEFEKFFASFWKQKFEAVGEAWPISKELSEDEQKELYGRVELRFLVQEIENALKPRP